MTGFMTVLLHHIRSDILSFMALALYFFMTHNLSERNVKDEEETDIFFLQKYRDKLAHYNYIKWEPFSRIVR